MKSIITFLLVFLSASTFSQTNENSFGVQLGGSLLLFNDCCYKSRIHSDPKLKFGYRIGLISRHTSGGRFFHDFQITYSRERIGYTEDRNQVIKERYLDYEAYHFIYYFGIEPIKRIPIRVFVGHNVGHIVHNFGDNVESELFGLNLKLELRLRLHKKYSIEPIIDFSWTYNKTTSYNTRVVFGLNFMSEI